MLPGAFWGQLGREHTMWTLLTHMVEACREGLLTQTLSRQQLPWPPDSWDNQYPYLLKTTSPLSKLTEDQHDKCPGMSCPYLKHQGLCSSRTWAQHSKGWYPARALSSVLFFQLQKCLVKAFTQSPGQPLWEFMGVLVLNSFRFIWGLAAGTRTVQSNSWTDCSALLAALLSTCLLLVLSSHHTSPVPCSPRAPKARGSGEWDLPQAEPGGLGEPGWQTPKQQRLIPSISHTHSFPEGLGSKRSLSQLQLHHNRLQLHLLPAQAARKEPSRAVPSLSPEKGWPQLHWLHNSSSCQHDWSCGMSEACSEVAPAQQTHSSCRLQHSHLPCLSSRVS